jgi:teichoic acid transport system permease protein
MTSTAHSLVRVGSKSGVWEYLRALWARREFALAIPSAELAAEHSNMVLGGLWHLLNPLIQILVYYLIFGVILGVDRGVDNFIGFLAVGVFIFHFTSRSFTAGARSITSNESLLRTISFPRAILPIAAVLSELASFGYALIAMVGVLLVTGETVSWHWLLIIPVIILQMLFNTGAACFMARTSTHFRDIQQVLPFVLRMWLYTSGVMWPISRLTDVRPDLLWIMELNPAYAFMELTRFAVLENEVGPANLWWSAGLWAVGSLTLGFTFFRARENDYGHD